MVWNENSYLWYLLDELDEGLSRYHAARVEFEAKAAAGIEMYPLTDEWCERDTAAEKVKAAIKNLVKEAL